MYYAYGDIVEKESLNPLTGGGGHSIIGNVVSKDLLKLAEDKDVKAVVLRVNSGGGSAYASEQIWRAVTLLKEKKPVVVSMGGMAASGGYYISCAANWIVSEPTTRTGSIGIFGMFPDFSNLITQKLGVKFDEVKTNKNSNFGTMSRPFNEEEMAYLNMYIDRGYELFRQRVADEVAGHAVIVGLSVPGPAQAVVHQAVRGFSVVVVRVDHREGAVHDVLAAEDRVRGAPGLFAPFGDPEAGGEQAFKLLEDVMRLHPFLHLAADDLPEILFQIFVDDEDDLFEARLHRVVQGIVDDDLPVGPDGIDLLEAAVTASHPRGHDDECRLLLFVHIVSPFSGRTAAR